jgi:hypothetical protein
MALAPVLPAACIRLTLLLRKGSKARARAVHQHAMPGAWRGV